MNEYSIGEIMKNADKINKRYEEAKEMHPDILVDNLDLWESVSKTDTAFTKKANKGQYSFTSIAPVYQFKLATDAFGPYGSGWGVTETESSISYKEIGETILINYDATLFYIVKTKRNAFPIHACEKLAYRTSGDNGYIKIDEEARKKVVTNAITKGLSMLGFNSDVFMGLFDDADYIAAAAAESDIAKAENKDAEIAKKQSSLVDYVEKHVISIDNATTKSEAYGIFKTSIRHLDRMAKIQALQSITERGKAKITRSYETKKAAISD